MAIEIKEKEYENYGRCLHISNGVIETDVTINCGPRIIRFGYCGEENMLFNDLDRKFFAKGEAFDSLYGKGSVFYHYGGHRVWISPENFPYTYCPDNEPVRYSLFPDKVGFISSPKKQSPIQTGFEIMMSDDGADMMVINTGKNISDDIHTVSLWAMTMMARGGLAIVPQSGALDDLNFVPNRMLALWPYSDLNDPRVFFGKRFITLSHDGTELPFRVGTDNRLGWGAYLRGSTAFVKRYIHNDQTVYPDLGSSFEVYMNRDYLSLETLSPLSKLSPGASTRHVENWSLFRAPRVPDRHSDTDLHNFFESLK